MKNVVTRMDGSSTDICMLDEEYETLKANACKIGGKLRRGYFLKSAMKQSI